MSEFNERFTKNKADVGKFIKEFDRQFDQELRTRNLVNHHETFSDLKLDEIKLTMLLAGSDRVGEMWKQQHQEAYRRTARTWALRARRQAQSASIFVDAVANALVRSRSVSRRGQGRVAVPQGASEPFALKSHGGCSLPDSASQGRALRRAAPRAGLSPLLELPSPAGKMAAMRSMARSVRWTPFHGPSHNPLIPAKAGTQAFFVRAGGEASRSGSATKTPGSPLSRG